MRGLVAQDFRGNQPKKGQEGPNVWPGSRYLVSFEAILRGLENFCVGALNGLEFLVSPEEFPEENLVEMQRHRLVASFYFNRSANILPEVFK